VLLDELPLPDVLPDVLLDELPLVEVPLPLLAATTWAVVAGAALPHPAMKIGADIAATFKRTNTETFFLIFMGLTRGIGYVEHVSWSPSLLRKTCFLLPPPGHSQAVVAQGHVDPQSRDSNCIWRLARLFLGAGGQSKKKVNDYFT
jgi:hypothetical protein